MEQKRNALPLLKLLLIVSTFLASAGAALSQAPSSIQIFMPGGGLPDRSIRFTLTRDDGRIETLFTDTKGKFQITGDLVRDADYIVTVEGDGRSFATTVATFRTFRNTIVYVPVFLRPIESQKRNSPGVLDVTDANVPAEARSLYQEAREKITKGEIATAIEDFKRALAIYPQYVRALNDLGVIYLQLNRFDEAASTFKQAIKIDQGFIYARLNLGLVLNRQQKHVEAAELLGKLVKENPNLTDALKPYAEALAETGRLSEAEKVLRTILQDTNVKNSIMAETHFRLGAVLNKQNRFAEAAVELKKAIELEPNAVMAHLQLGGALIQLNRLPEAEQELAKAYELGGSSAGAAQFLLGQVFYLESRYEPALKAFEQYLKDVPNAPNAEQVREVVAKIKAALKQK